MFFSGDDMMNMYNAWSANPWRLARAQLMIWLPVYRPLGAAVYRIFYAAFGFHPRPLYVFCWLLLALNAVLAYRFFHRLAGTPILAFTALSLTLVHGNFQDLYLSAGTIYDRLWFLFTVVGIMAYARMREDGRPIAWGGASVIVVLSILSMDSKESGVALPLLLACYELVYVLRRDSFKRGLRAIWPLHLTLTTLCVVFVFFRVDRTPVLAANAAYRPHLDPGLWFHRMGEYFGVLSYGHVRMSGLGAGLLLGSMAATAALLRNRAMIFGWLFFVITITPVALIEMRPGYVLYVPGLGLGLFVAGLVGVLVANRYRGWVFTAITVPISLFHWYNWPVVTGSHDLPEYRLTEQFSHDYPKLPQRTNLLFVSDGFPKDAYDLLFNLRLMYRDPTINADRMEGPPEQQPDPYHPKKYDHIYVHDGGAYFELDNRNPAESIRLLVLKNYTVGRQMDMVRRDHTAYFVSGIMDGDIEATSRWTTPHARLKFDLYPAAAVYTVGFWLPNYVAKTAIRTMAITVNGKSVGTLPLSRDGLNQVSFPVPADCMTLNGFTVVGMDVTNPWKDKDGIEYGVVLLKAGFEYSRP